MNRFILKIGVFIAMLVVTYCLFVDKLSKGPVDEYYNKLTQGSNSLVLGMSRAHQGIVPHIIEEELNNAKSLEMVNYAFTSSHSRYGKVYLNSIKKKLTNREDKGLFIVSVTPGSFTAPIGLTDEEIYKMDKKTILGKTNDVDSNPNYNYIINCYPLPLYNAICEFNHTENIVSHTDGWNEVKLESHSFTVKESDIAHWKTLTLRNYNRRLEKEAFSDYRFNGFINTIEFLNTQGQVFIVRIPADVDILDIENNHYKLFDKTMDSISKVHNIPYLNYSKNGVEYKTYDGSHMESESAKKFTKILSNDIKLLLKEN